MTGQRQNDFDEDYLKRLTGKARRIDNDATHPLVLEFSQRRVERSGRPRQPKYRTLRYRNSFIPQAIAALNTTSDKDCNYRRMTTMGYVE